MSVTTTDGVHTVEFQLRGIRIHRRCPRGATKAEAEALETKLRHDIFAAGDLGVKPDVSLPAAIQIWIEEQVAGSKSELSRRRHALALAPYVIGKVISQIPDVADAYRKTARRQGLAEATINNRLNVLKAVARFCWRKRWASENLSARVELKDPNNARHFYLTAAQLRSQVRKMPTVEGKAWIALLASTGLRRAELHALGKVGGGTVRRAVVYLPAKTKGGAPRAVPVAKPGLPHLKALPFERTVDSLEWEFRQAREAAGFPELHQHDLRHTYASLLINQGVPLYVVGELLGHKTTQTTKRYSHLYLKTLKEAVGRIAK